MYYSSPRLLLYAFIVIIPLIIIFSTFFVTHTSFFYSTFSSSSLYLFWRVFDFIYFFLIQAQYLFLTFTVKLIFYTINLLTSSNFNAISWFKKNHAEFALHEPEINIPNFIGVFKGQYCGNPSEPLPPLPVPNSSLGYCLEILPTTFPHNTSNNKALVSLLNQYKLAYILGGDLLHGNCLVRPEFMPLSNPALRSSTLNTGPWVNLCALDNVILNYSDILPTSTHSNPLIDTSLKSNFLLNNLQGSWFYNYLNANPSDIPYFNLLGRRASYPLSAGSSFGPAVSVHSNSENWLMSSFQLLAASLIFNNNLYNFNVLKHSSLSNFHSLPPSTVFAFNSGTYLFNVNDSLLNLPLLKGTSNLLIPQPTLGDSYLNWTSLPANNLGWFI